jgi:CBS domain-containing protein
MRAADIMEKGVVTVSPELPLHDFEELLSGEGISGAPVTDADGKVLGIASKTDIIEALSQRIPDALELGPELCVADVMTEGAVSVPPDATLAEVARTMVDGGLHRVLVSEGERLLGVVSALDVLRAVAARRSA